MTHDTTITLRGRLGGDVVLRRAGEHPVATFRVAVTPRRLERATGTWVDQETQWYSVSTWRALAENCAVSLRRGDAVVVHGRLTLHRYTTKAGVEAQDWRIEAATVGPDLTRGATAWRRGDDRSDDGGGEPGPVADPTRGGAGAAVGAPPAA